jgi:hypothetical protein
MASCAYDRSTDGRSNPHADLFHQTRPLVGRHSPVRRRAAEELAGRIANFCWEHLPFIELMSCSVLYQGELCLDGNYAEISE